ncbi:hypothetical protein LQW54_000561 [Pestalotiopsis sp. IQ-011]
MQLFLEFFLGVFGGVLLDGGHWRAAMVGGSGLFIFAFFMLSLCREGQYAPIILSQGVGMGLGLGLAFLPLFGVVAKHFTKRRSLAMGILTTGSSLGGFAFSVLVNKLFHTSLGFAWTVRVSSFVTLGCLVLGNLLISEPKPSMSASSDETPSSSQEASAEVAAPDQPQEDKPRGIPELLRDPAYLAVIGSGFIVCLGLYFPIRSLWSLGVCALDPYVTSAGLRLGIACLPLAFAALIGTPITEAIIGTDQNWWHGIAFAGTAILVAAAFLAFALMVERGRKGTKKMGRA